MKPNDSKIEEVYDEIAESFYRLRRFPISPEIKKLAEEWKPGSLLDIGCGIGNSTLPFAKKGFQCVGIDVSKQQLKFAKEYLEKNSVSVGLKYGNFLNLSFGDEKFDYVISVAVLHHLDSVEKRLKALGEINRVLKPDGLIFLTVWNISESKKDTYVTWENRGIKYPRYYHVFDLEELKELFEKSGFKGIEVFLDKKEKNICVKARKR